jgi:hypothetical protein
MSVLWIYEFVCICLHLSAFVYVLSTWATPNGCTVLEGYAPLKVAQQGEVATDLTFLTGFIFFYPILLLCWLTSNCYSFNHAFFFIELLYLIIAFRDYL